MIRRNVNRNLIYLLFILAMVACSTKKTAVRMSAEDVANAGFVAASPAFVVERKDLVGNVRISAGIGEKEFSASGTVRIKKGEGIQIGITPLGLVEVASLELFPSTMRFINKIGKEYVEQTYSSIPYLYESGVDYNLLESVLMNHLFLPVDSAGIPLNSKISYSNDDSYVVATAVDDNGITYMFTLEKSTANLVKTEGYHASGVKVVCSYSDFKELDGVMFPNTVNMHLEGTGTVMTLVFKFSGLKTKSLTLTPRKISSSYDRIDIGEMIKSLGNM